MKKKTVKEDKAKIIHLPPKTIDGLKALAKDARMTTKPYMEKILIEFEHKNAK